MEDFYNDINYLISSKLPFQRRREILALLKNDNKLREEFEILLHSREYLKVKSALVEIEHDPEQLHAMEQVQNHFANSKPTYDLYLLHFNSQI